MTDGINGTLERIIRQAGKRHEILASNIANADTPNYKARDISFNQVLGTEVGLVTTNPKHIPVSDGNSSSAGEVRIVDAASWEDKNNVELDQEMAKMTENALRHQAGVTLLIERQSMFKNALRTG